MKIKRLKSKLERLPRFITYNGQEYSFEMHITEDARICFCYKGLENNDTILEHIIDSTAPGSFQVPEDVTVSQEIQRYSTALSTLSVRLLMAKEAKIINYEEIVDNYDEEEISISSSSYEEIKANAKSRIEEIKYQNEEVLDLGENFPSSEIVEVIEENKEN